MFISVIFFTTKLRTRDSFVLIWYSASYSLEQESCLRASYSTLCSFLMETETKTETSKQRPWKYTCRPKKCRPWKCRPQKHRPWKHRPWNVKCTAQKELTFRTKWKSKWKPVKKNSITKLATWLISWRINWTSKAYFSVIVHERKKQYSACGCLMKYVLSLSFLSSKDH